MNRIDERADSDGKVPEALCTEAAPQILIPSKTSSRRAWLRRGVAIASPVVVSLVSAPVHAGNLCLLHSGFISTATFNSRHPGGLVCTTQGPSVWHANFPTTKFWPVAAKKATFTSTFGVSAGVETGIVVSTTLDDVLGNVGGSYSQLAKYCIAAYLNALKGGSGIPLSTSEAVAVYKSYHPGPVAVPLVSTWTQANTVTWLQSLMSP